MRLDRLMRQFVGVLLAVVCGVWVCGEAFAQAAEVSPKALCAGVAVEKQAECEAQMDNLRAILDDQWPAFSGCAGKLDLNRAHSDILVSCLNAEMEAKIKAQIRADAAAGTPPTDMGGEAKTPVNGKFFSVQEVCASVKPEEMGACLTGLEDIQAVLGEALWTELAACGVKQDLSNGGESLMLCLSADMTQKLMDAAKAKTP